MILIINFKNKYKTNMLTLRQLFEKYGYSIEFKFKTNKKFLVPLNQLEITSWVPMGDGIFPKHNACLCDDCKRSAIGYYHDYLQRNDDKNIIDGFTYPDVLNLEVDVRNFYIDAFPANFNTSPKLNEEEITKMFYNRIINANEITVDIEDFNTQCETYDEERDIYDECGKNKEEFDCSTCRTDICNNCHEKHSVCVLKKEVDDEFWVDNDLIQTVRNLNNKIKELTRFQKN